MEHSPGGGCDRRWRVAIVDGNPDVRAALTLLLERHPSYSVTTVAEDLDTLGRAAHSPDVILLDWDLREVQTNDCVAELRRLYPAAVVIALSTRNEQRAAALAAGAAAFVCKNEAPAQLLAALVTR
jgi:CheY-like chemotaxis protein